MGYKLWKANAWTKAVVVQALRTLLWTLAEAGCTGECQSCWRSTCGGPPVMASPSIAIAGSRTELLQKLLKNYDNLLRPNFEDGNATIVTCDVYINSFDSINVDTMDYSLNIYMRQSWQDPRLAYGHMFDNITKLTLDNKLFSQIWVPDVFFPNEKESNQHCVTVPNRLIRIHPNGTVLYSARYTLRLSCHMKLEQFPLDKQECAMKIESYGYTTDEIQFKWREEKPVQLNDMELPQFDLTNHTVGKCTGSYITGDYACLKVTFFLERQYGYYMIQTYIPSILIVSLSWVSFWINLDAVPARISLGVLTVLTLTTQCVGVWMSLPRVSYVKAIDIWMSACVIFVFSAMLEFAVVNTLSRREIRQMSLHLRNKTQGDIPHDMIRQMLDEYTYGASVQFNDTKLIARTVDNISRTLFPTAFSVFNVIYWCVFLLR